MDPYEPPKQYAPKRFEIASGLIVGLFFFGSAWLGFTGLTVLAGGDVTVLGIAAPIAMMIASFWRFAHERKSGGELPPEVKAAMAKNTIPTRVAVFFGLGLLAFLLPLGLLVDGAGLRDCLLSCLVPAFLIGLSLQQFRKARRRGAPLPTEPPPEVPDW